MHTPDAVYPSQRLPQSISTSLIYISYRSLIGHVWPVRSSRCFQTAFRQYRTAAFSDPANGRNFHNIEVEKQKWLVKMKRLCCKKNNSDFMYIALKWYILIQHVMTYRQQICPAKPMLRLLLHLPPHKIFATGHKRDLARFLNFQAAVSQLAGQSRTGCQASWLVAALHCWLRAQKFLPFSLVVTSLFYRTVSFVQHR